MPTSDDPRRTAAELTVTMLRAQQSAILAGPTEPPSLPGILGDTAFKVLPEGNRLLRQEFAAWLAEAPKPVITVPTYLRGVIAAWPRLSAPWVTAAMDNQREILATYRSELGLGDGATVVVDTVDEHRTFPYSHLEEWGRTYGVEAGWYMRRPEGIEGDIEMVLVAPTPTQWGP